MDSAPQQQDVYTLTEFARRNRISLSTTYIEIRAGRLTARKVGRRTIITVEDEKAWRDRLPVVQRTNNDAGVGSRAR
jgi:hypothetical protein